MMSICQQVIVSYVINIAKYKRITARITEQVKDTLNQFFIQATLETQKILLKKITLSTFVIKILKYSLILLIIHKFRPPSLICIF